MVKNGVDVIHLATGFVVAYPLCPYIKYFKDFIQEKYKVNVIIGTHLIPEKYFITHNNLKTWYLAEWHKIID